VRQNHLSDALKASTTHAESSGRTRASLTPSAGKELAARRSRDDDGLRIELERLLTQHEGNVAAVAREMDCAPVQVRRWAKHFNLDLESYRAKA